MRSSPTWVPRPWLSSRKQVMASCTTTQHSQDPQGRILCDRSLRPQGPYLFHGPRGLAQPREPEADVEKVGDEGVVSLANAMEAGALPRLTELDLSLAGLGDRGALALAQVLKNGACLLVKMLKVEGNTDISEEARAELMTMPMSPGTTKDRGAQVDHVMRAAQRGLRLEVILWHQPS